VTTYYVSPWGADANNGLGPDASAGTNKPWLTIGKALGASGIASGDTVYLCPGIYREAVTVNMTSATATTSVIGDVQNSRGFKDGNGVLIPGGYVIWTAATVNDFTNTSGTTLTLNGRDFLTFQYIWLVSARASTLVQGSTKTSTDITFQFCAFTAGYTSTSINVNAAANVALNWTIDSCIFNDGTASGNIIQFAIDTPATADFNVNVVIKNSMFMAAGTIIRMQQGLTANAFKYGGCTVYNCSLMCGSTNFFIVGDANHSTSVTSAVYNCFIQTFGTALTANTTGQLLEDYNIIDASTARSNVTAGTHSVAQQYHPLIEFGQSPVFGMLPKPLGAPIFQSPLLGFGAQGGGPSVDMFNKNRPAGVTLGAFGTATAGAAKTLTDTAKSWGTNQFKGWTIKLTAGTGSGQTKSIASNTGTVITVDGNWKTNPSTDSTYVVYWGDLSSTGTATAGTTTTLTDSNAAWGTNQWAGYTVSIDSGTGSGQTATVASNTATALTFAAITAPDSTSTYSLYKATNVNTQDYAAGAIERHDTAQKETTTTDAGGVAITLTGKSDHEFRIPVDAASTTISVKVQYDAAHGTTNKPQAVLLANNEIGVSTETKTATGGAGSWETLTFTAINPTAKGWVVVRIVSRSDAPAGRAFFDTLAVA
jgi:hypothetical protein